MTIITDKNIHSLVYNYCKDKEKSPVDLHTMPIDLQTVPIGEWDVSQVTNFNNLFTKTLDFNEPLNWDTSNVVSMIHTFSGCKEFNQPLKWNVKKVKNMRAMFSGCEEFDQPLEWETDSVSDTSFMFFNCKKFNQPLNWNMGKVVVINDMFRLCDKFNQPLPWDVSQVEDMSNTFDECLSFNQSLRWDVSNVTNMRSMFSSCISFDGELTGISTSEWDVRKVQDMMRMFYECLSFNQKIDWDTEKLTNVKHMFMNCKKLNKPIHLNLKNISDMSFMFSDCTEFNQPLNFDVSKASNMENMFQDCSNFNQTLRWDVSNVLKMNRMFSGCQMFNSPLVGITEPHWDVSKVYDMAEMFENCDHFNQPLVWDVAHVEYMYGMFSNCRDFNQPLAWNLDHLEYCSLMFANTPAFNQNLTQWDMTDIMDKEDMFVGSGIEDRNLPIGIDPVEPVEAGPPVEVNAYQIHQFSAKVDIERLNAFFHSKTLFQPETIEPISEFLYSVLNGMIQQLDTYATEEETEKLKELDVLNTYIKTDTNAEISHLNVPSETVKRLYQKRKNILDKIHTSKQLTQPVHYIKKIDRLLSMATMKRKEALELEKSLLTELDQVDKEIKMIRMDKKKKEKLLVLLEEQDKMTILSGRKNLLEHEIKNERDKIVKHHKDLDKIMRNVLSRLNFSLYSEKWRISILYALDYVERQPLLFKKAYVESFLKDCVNAYEGVTGMSCATGVLERFIISLMAGCGASLSVSENPEYEYIKGIVENGLNKLIPEYILKWYKLHSHDPYRFTTETKEQRLDNLKKYLLSFFPENEELILSLIPQYAIDIDNEDFAYKKENSAERINMNEVYASVSHEEKKPVSILSRLTKLIPIPIPRKKTKSSANRKTKKSKKRPAPKPRVRSTLKTKQNKQNKTFKMGAVVGTAFG
jgi:hypothetical protein